MKIRSTCLVATWLVIATFYVRGQVLQPAKPPAPTAKIAGRVLAADTGKPLQRASVTLIAQPSKMTRIALTDADGRYEFSGLPPGRYGVSPSKNGYVVIHPDPFSTGRGLDIAAGEIADRTDFMLPRGSVITGRITDEFGEPIAGVIVQAARYQFRPSGQRQLIQGSTGNFYMPSGTNDLGEFRIFGLRPGSYYVSARLITSLAIAVGQNETVTGVDSEDGLATTYYPGTISVSDAQTVQVGLMHEANVSFPLVPARMARVSGTVRDSHGGPVSDAQVTLRPSTRTGGIIQFGSPTARLSRDGSFALANVAPGDYIIEVRPTPQTPGVSAMPTTSNEHASLPLAVAGENIAGLAVTTTPGISVSGRVIFEGKSDIARSNLRISAPSEEDARNFVQVFTYDGDVVDDQGRFHIPGVFGKVMFRTSPLPQNVMLKSVTLNGVDITNTPFDATEAEDVTDLRVVLVDKQGRISGFARNPRGEIQYNYRLVVYPANLKEGDVSVRFQHNTGPNVKGQFNIGRMPPGEYIGLAVKGVQPGEEWDPELRKRIEQYGKRFTLREGETLELEMPYVE